ncbi:hypothetical protein A5727_16460 [Mycobacterium sp. ACS4331]|nr:hypothetical protein A5727_16460 [Mycobacterium sp. ACS4331]
MTVRPDNRLADTPMRPVECGTCGARVLVRKSSWEQTSVQWNADAVARCARSNGAAAQELTLCPQLRSAIETAVLQGTLPVLDEAESPSHSAEQSHAHRG